MSKVKAAEILTAWDEVWAEDPIATSTDDSPWREDPLPLDEFVRSDRHLSSGKAISLFPAQLEDLRSFLGATAEDAKALFSQEPPTEYNCAALIYGKSCLGADEKLYDHATGETRSIGEWAAIGKPLLLDSWDGLKIVRQWSSPPSLLGTEMLYRVEMEDGRSFVATAGHRCLSLQGWLPLGSFVKDQTQLLAKPLDSNAQIDYLQRCKTASHPQQNPFSESGDRAFETSSQFELERLAVSTASAIGSSFAAQNSLVCADSPSFLRQSVLCGWNKDQDSPVGCHLLSHLDDEQLHSSLKTVPAFAPSPAYAPAHIPHDLHVDDCRAEPFARRSRSYRRSDRLLVSASRQASHAIASEHRNESTCGVVVPRLRRIFQKAQSESCLNYNQTPSAVINHSEIEYSFLDETLPLSTLPEVLQCASPSCPQLQITSHQHSDGRSRNRYQPQTFDSFFSSSSLPVYYSVKSIEPLQYGAFYDLTVPDTACYFDAQGILHHNSGKGYMVSICLAWFVYVLLCLKDPQEFLGLAPAEPIDIALCSPTLRQTRQITFQKFKNRFYSWEWFRERLSQDGIDPDRFLKNKIGADFICFPNNIRVHNLPLDATAAEGFNLLAFCIDELAGLTSEATSDSASALLNTFITSARSRFKKAWKGWVIGFPRSVNDPQEQIVADHEAGKFPNLMVRRRATWEVNLSLKESDFEVEKLRNPEDFEAKFRAIPMAASQNFFRSPELIIKNAIGGDPALLRKAYPDLTDGQINAIASYMPDPVIERDMLGDVVLNEYGFPRLHSWFRGQTNEAGNAIEIYIHIDVGLSRDSTGLAIAYLDAHNIPVLSLGFRWKASHFAKFGTIKRWNWGAIGTTTESVNAAEVDLQTVADFVIWLQKARGFSIAQVTCDGFNSAQLLQAIRKHEIPVGLHVADKADYDELKGHIYARTMRYRCDRILYQELIKLVVINATKVEAPRTKLGGDSSGADSHKDLADAAAVVIGTLSRMIDDSTVPIEFEAIEDIWERSAKTGEPIRVEMETEKWNELQQQVFQQFLDE